MADNNNQGGTPSDNDDLTYESWFEGQDDSIKELINGHQSGLKSALKTERENGKKLTGELKSLSKELESGTAAKEQIDQLTARLEAADQRTVAYESLQSAGVKNLKLGFLAAQADDLIRNDGTIDLAILKERNPELFVNGTPPPSGAGNGGGNGTPKATMNDFIRAAAGRSV